MAAPALVRVQIIQHENFCSAPAPVFDNGNSSGLDSGDACLGVDVGGAYGGVSCPGRDIGGDDS